VTSRCAHNRRGSFLGTGSGLSAATVTRLAAQWQDEAKAFGNRDLSTVDYVYLWADGVHLNVRLDSEKLCLLVMVGVRVDGTKELVALAEGYRESTGSWADLLRDCARRGMRAPMLAVGDGALGFWAALREVFPTTREQRCWFHKIGNVLSALPKSAHPAAKRALAEIWNAEDREHARRAVAAFKLAYGVKFAKAVAKIVDDLDELLAFYDYPAEHWVHLRTTNPIESTFAPVRHRTKVTKGPGSKAAGLAMAFKLIEAAQHAGAQSTHPTSSPSCAPAPASNAANSSNAPPSPPPPSQRRRPDASSAGTTPNTATLASPGTPRTTSTMDAQVPRTRSARTSWPPPTPATRSDSSASTPSQPPCPKPCGSTNRPTRTSNRITQRFPEKPASKILTRGVDASWIPVSTVFRLPHDRVSGCGGLCDGMGEPAGVATWPKLTGIGRTACSDR